MKRLLIVLILFFSYASYSQTTKEYYNIGMQNINNSKFNEAIENFTKLIEIDKLNSNAYVNRALAKQYLGQYSDAILDLNKATEINPKYALAYLNRGNNKQFMNEDRSAISDYSKALQIEIEFAPPPIHTYSYIGRGASYHKIKKYKLAINDFNEAIKLDPTYPQSYFNRGLSKALSDETTFCGDFKKSYELGFIQAKEFIDNYCNKPNPQSNSNTSASSSASSSNFTSRKSSSVSSVVSAGAFPKFSFQEEQYDFGDIQENDVVSHTFSFTNTGDAPLIISKATATCGCIVPQWTRQPIPVGGTGEIKVQFDSSNKPGIQNKVVTITANTESKVKKILIKAQVNNSPF